MNRQNETPQPPRVRDFLEAILPICWKGFWLSMEEMVVLTKLHPGSIRWCIRQLQTGEEGEFIVRRRKREPLYKGTMEYYIKRKPAQMRFNYDEK